MKQVFEKKVKNKIILILMTIIYCNSLL